jgi:hypothetical protein
MKVKVVIRDERVAEVVMDFNHLPQVGDLVEVAQVGEVKVLSVITTRKNPEYQAAVIAAKTQE